MWVTLRQGGHKAEGGPEKLGFRWAGEMAGGRREASRGKWWIVGLNLEVPAVKTLSWWPMRGGCVGAIQMLDSAGFEGQCIVHLTASGRPAL